MEGGEEEEFGVRSRHVARCLGYHTHHEVEDLASDLFEYGDSGKDAQNQTEEHHHEPVR